MLTIDDQLLAIDDAIDEVVAAFLALDSVQDYLAVRQVFLSDKALQEDIAVFQALRQEYEAVETYAAFRPEVKTLRRQLVQTKRTIDMHEKMSALRQSEVAVQKILAELTQDISSVISSAIFVDTGLPLAATHLTTNAIIKEDKLCLKRRNDKGLSFICIIIVMRESWQNTAMSSIILEKCTIKFCMSIRPMRQPLQTKLPV